MGAVRTKHPRSCTFFILQPNPLLNSNNWGTQVYFFSWMKEDIVLTQRIQGRDSCVLGTYATASSTVILIVILTIYFLSKTNFLHRTSTLVYNRAKFARANYIFLKLISILDTIENSGVHTYISGQADQRNMMPQTLVSNLSVPGTDTTEV